MQRCFSFIGMVRQVFAAIGVVATTLFKSSPGYYSLLGRLLDQIEMGHGWTGRMRDLLALW